MTKDKVHSRGENEQKDVSTGQRIRAGRSCKKRGSDSPMERLKIILFYSRLQIKLTVNGNRNKWLFKSLSR